MTTFTTEDRILAEKDGSLTVNVNAGEAVAYIDRQDLERLPHYDCWVNGQQHKNSVPLYTHPTKTLTDKEIEQIFKDETGFFLNESPMALMDFARAILRKAQEK